ncbi:acyltransferase [Curtobacterium sp. MCBD17_032]|uniref:acyltransferase family protein n=1 Tax=Curtobacterium sp. MCBD17_032 TaxID=2175659 RepID=UPI000DA8F4AC|nr:acyltransferase [Curtobacterium sp. MCBD17_032]PZE86192.1 hypothetical protein DEI91_03530 [Curtobacterium sp. MCBD17_032]
MSTEKSADAPATGTPERGRVATAPVFHGIQALRFVAALLVVLAHVPSYLRHQLGVAVPDVPLGAVGVTVFFVISGFVATVVTSRRPPVDWRAFLWRRVVRIVPLAWTMTTVKLAVAVLDPDQLQRATLTPAYVVLSYAFLPARGSDGIVQPLWTVAWTLSFELLFYLLVAVALAWRTAPLRVVTPVCVALAVAGALRSPTDWPAWQFHADPIVLCFPIGMVVGRWATGRAQRSDAGVVAGLMVSWVLTEWGHGSSLGTVLLLPAAAVVVAGVAASERRTAAVVGRGVLTLGDASYALYLTHPLVVPVAVAAVGRVLGDRALEWPRIAVVALVAVVAVTAATVASVLVWWTVDRPVLRALRRLRAPAPPGRRSARSGSGGGPSS